MVSTGAPRSARPEQPVCLLALTPDEIDQVADISRVTRDDEGKLLGYQRAEVKQHVDGIVEYLDSENPLMPNAIVLALSSNVQFKRSRGPNVDDGVVAAGSLEIPLPANEGPKPAWIVDGQQEFAPRRGKSRSFRFLSRRSLPTLLRCSVTSSFA